MKVIGNERNAAPNIETHEMRQFLWALRFAPFIKNVFGDIYKNIPVSSIKSMLGHTMGAASAIEAISCCLAVKEGVIPPTINYQTPDPECDIDCVPNEARKQEVDIALNNSSAFGGNNACLVLRKLEK